MQSLWKLGLAEDRQHVLVHLGEIGAAVDVGVVETDDLLALCSSVGEDLPHFVTVDVVGLTAGPRMCPGVLSVEFVLPVSAGMDPL